MILVTGGAGYIGSHACVALLAAGEEVVVFDNFSNSNPLSLERVREISGKSLAVVEGDVRDQGALETVLAEYRCTAVMHFAGLKSVQDLVAQPLEYYDHNVIGSHRLLAPCKTPASRRSSFHRPPRCTAHRNSCLIPRIIRHTPSNPYGRTKLVIEDMLRDQYASDASWGIAILRYFNPVGAHESGKIGEDPKGVPNNLVPFVAQVAIGRRERLNVWGNDYDTPDGTGVRDYIHVMDLASGHVSALKLLDEPKCYAVNLGTGAGSSVLDVVRAFEAASGKRIPYDVKPRRPGDLAAYYAATDYASRLMDWKATRSLEAMCADHWRWQNNNPNGYA